jgi:hypothetical protein
MTVEHWKLDSRENKLERGLGGPGKLMQRKREKCKKKERNKIIIIL